MPAVSTVPAGGPVPAGPFIRVIGEVMVDVIAHTSSPPAPGSDAASSVTDQDGGSAANVAAWLAELDVPVQLIARVGADARGDGARERLTAAGVTLSVSRDPSLPTGRCVVIVTPDGERTMFPDPGANTCLSESDVDTLAWSAGEHLHASGYSLLREGSRAAVLAALDRARGLGLTVSVDASSEAPLRDLGPEAFLGWLEPGDLLFANAAEAQALTGRASAEDALEALVDGGLLAVVKLGGAGALAGDGSLRWGVPAVPADARDTTGAGDAFAAGFLASWTRDRDVEEALRLATRLAARAVTLQGGRP